MTFRETYTSSGFAALNAFLSNECLYIYYLQLSRKQNVSVSLTASVNSFSFCYDFVNSLYIGVSGNFPFVYMSDFYLIVYMYVVSNLDNFVSEPYFRHQLLVKYM